jgi:hypothetical protein
MAFTCPRCGRTSHHPEDEEFGYCGSCHEFTQPPPRSHPVAFRVWVNDRLADETTIELGTHDERIEWLASLQADLCNKAEEEGKRWLVEVEFWDGETVKWGTDRDGLVTPVRIGLGRLLEAIEERWGPPR